MKSIDFVIAATTLFAAISNTALAQDAGFVVPNPRAVVRVERRLRITPQQRDQARGILQQERPTLERMRTSLIAERKEMAASANGGFDPTPAQAIALKYAGVNANVVVERAKLRAELLAILTPQQQAKLQQLRARIATVLRSDAPDRADTM